MNESWELCNTDMVDFILKGLVSLDSHLKLPLSLFIKECPSQHTYIMSACQDGLLFKRGIKCQRSVSSG